MKRNLSSNDNQSNKKHKSSEHCNSNGYTFLRSVFTTNKNINETDDCEEEIIIDLSQQNYEKSEENEILEFTQKTDDTYDKKFIKCLEKIEIAFEIQKKYAEEAENFFNNLNLAETITCLNKLTEMIYNLKVVISSMSTLMANIEFLKND